MSFNPPNTPEQSDILDFSLTRKESLLVNALAGTAKTTTLERVAIALSGTPILYIVFNKRNQEEAAKRMPGHVMCKTANALGHGVWSKFIGRRLTVNTRKNYEILKSLVDELGAAEKREAYESFSTILTGVRAAKISGYTPRAKFETIQSLTSEDPFDEEPTWLGHYLLDTTLTQSIKAAFDGTIDFDDQIYMPVLFGGTWPRFPLVVVDEAQDLSPLNHAMLQRLVTDRIIAVGDPYQSIYAFRGAVQHGMASLSQTYSMDTRTLSISFRCPRAIVKNAHWRVPHFRYPDWAKEGEVNDLDHWTASSIDDNSAIICRNNAPLLSCALRLIRLGRGVRLVGSDIGPNLVRILKKLGPESMKQTEVLDAIDRYEAAATAKSRSHASLADKCDCLRVFAGAGPDLSAAIGNAEHIFKAGGTIQLLSGHKAKGLEWETVYHLDSHRIPSTYARTDEELEQEWNVKYVIETRAKRVLNKVNLEDLQ
jgi:DNA helicase-2/ATP-dependent DNA helicase PcrA